MELAEEGFNVVAIFVPTCKKGTQVGECLSASHFVENVRIN